MTECTSKMKDLSEYISMMNTDVTGLKKAAEEEIKSIEAITPPVKTKIVNDLRGFITEQQEEYFRLHKELCILSKEKTDISKDIAKSLERIESLEDSLGIPHAKTPSVNPK